MRIERYERPDNLAKAAHLVLDEGGYPLAGAVWSGIGARRIPLAVDLSRLDLDYIADRGDCIEIGAMTTVRQLETSALLEAVYDGLFRSATGHIAGVQLRNIVTVGGSVAGKYGFSDLDTLLLALGAQLLFYGGGVMSMEGFLAAPRTEAFLLLALRLPKGVKASYQSLRISANDFPALNACAAREEGGWRLAVGARPAAARLCPTAAAILGDEPRPGFDAAAAAGRRAAEELSFGSDTRCGPEYRRAICPVLLRRAILEAVT